jgi:8-oxo-dGTP pyrophosphatase MutT (NUDIX family)
MSGPKPWKELQRRFLVDCRVFSVESSLAVSPHDGSEHEFFRIVSVDFAQIVPVTRDGNVVLVEQYRHGTQALSLEIPAGLIEPGEAPAAAAARECLEETGYEAKSVEPLGRLATNPGVFSNHLHAFVAHNVERVAEIQNSATEFTAVRLAPINDLPGLLTSGRIDHALDAAVLWRFLYAESR